MSDKPNCLAKSAGARCSRSSNSGLTVISLFNGNLRSFRELPRECNDHGRCFNVERDFTLKTARKMLEKVAGCTIEVHKCIQ